MSEQNEDFRERYKHHPIRKKAVSEFKETTKYSVSKNVRHYMCQVMATIGMELESKFSDFIIFDEENFQLFGREKSKKSISDKKKENIAKYDKMFLEAIESDNQENIPTNVRPIFDYYALKLVCPELKEPKLILNAVVDDMLSDISERFPSYSNHVTMLRSSLNHSFPIALDFINDKFPDIYPGLKNKILVIIEEQKNVETIQNYLDRLPQDVSSLTYGDYYSELIECYQILIKLSYEESIDEFIRIAQAAEESKKEYVDIISKGQSKEKIPNELHEKYNLKLDSLLQHISNKKTNKLDLALGDLMVFDVLTTSKSLKNLGVKYSKDPTRTKKKRNPNGYVANFYSLDMPNGLTSEIQLQSAYRYEYGEHGPAAHNKMQSGTKERKLYKKPSKKKNEKKKQRIKKYKKWAKKQFKALPKYFKYTGDGNVVVYSTSQSFVRYYDCLDEDTVQDYADYIAKNDVDMLYGKHYKFSLDEVCPIKKDKER